ncbi:MAG: transcriptional regulator [Acidimicrobiales bacterium]|nr:transcriptional regulator [Acidimicrobiales bacterium]
MTLPNHPVLEALAPIAKAVGGEIVPKSDIASGDVPVQWDGTTIAGFRLAPMQTALDRLVASVENELGSKLAALDRVEKQVAVRLLDEKGAFLLRKSIEDVADQMGVSRITIYNYLNTVRETASSKP